MNKTRPLPSRYRSPSKGDGVITGILALAMFLFVLFINLGLLALAVWVVVWVLQQMGVL